MNLSMPSKKERECYLKTFDKILQSGIFIMGKEVEAFEKKISEYCNCKYSVGVGSGTDALILALLSYDIKQGDEVIIPDISFIATANAVSITGATPIFCDVNDDFNININSLEKTISSKTKAIIPVHYGGRMANMEAIKKITKKYKLIVIEDASQAFGAKRNNKMAGTLGDLGCFSLNPMKPLGAFGEAGVITTNSKSRYKKLKSLRYNGLDHNKKCIYKSLNGKIDTLQAAFLTMKIDMLNETTKKRKEIADYYNKHLKKYVIIPITEENNKDAFFTYTILVKEELRDELFTYLLNKKIEVKINNTSMHKEPAYLKKGINLQNSIKVSKMKLALPCHEKLKRKEIQYIVYSIKKFFNEM